jgi:hypothetical protein
LTTSTSPSQPKNVSPVVLRGARGSAVEGALAEGLERCLEAML